MTAVLASPLSNLVRPDHIPSDTSRSHAPSSETTAIESTHTKKFFCRLAHECSVGVSPDTHLASVSHLTRTLNKSVEEYIRNFCTGVILPKKSHLEKIKKEYVRNFILGGNLKFAWKNFNKNIQECQDTQPQLSSCSLTLLVVFKQLSSCSLSLLVVFNDTTHHGEWCRGRSESDVDRE